MKTIAITVTHGLMVRNILRTDIFKVLKANRNTRIAIVVLPFTAFYKNRKFAAEFSGKNVVVIDWPYKINPVEWLLRKMGDLIFFNTNYVETMRIRETVQKKKKYSRYLLLKLLKKILGKNKNLIEAMERFDRLLFRYKNKKYWGMFGEYKPSLVFSTDFLCPYEWGLTKAAKHYKVPVITMVPSWDHLTKGRLPTKFDRVIVWNDFVREQLIDYYGYEPSEIFLSGIPQFDYYVRVRDKILPRAKFLKTIGATPSQKLITYTTSPPIVSPYQQDIIEIICEAIKNGEIKYPSHLYIRFHPADNFSRYEKLRKYGDIVTFEAPGKSASSAKYVWNPDWKDMLHFANLLFHSDIVINVCSTVTIDASAFDTPVINIAFDGYEKKPYLDSMLRYYDYTHYKRIVKTMGAKIAKSREELIKYINEYLKNPKLDRNGRRRIVDEMCYKLDGKAGERIAKYILDFLHGKGG